MSQILGNSIILPSGGGGGKTQENKSYSLTDNDILSNTFSVIPDSGYDNMEKVNVNTDVFKADGAYPYLIKANCEIINISGTYTIEFVITSSSLREITLTFPVTYGQLLPIYIPCNNGLTIKTKNTGSYFTTLPTIQGSAVLAEGSVGSSLLTYKIAGDCNIINFGNIMCIIKGTLITLANGTKKPIEDVTYDDDLLVWDFYNGCFASAKPRWIKIEQTASIYNELTFSNGYTLGLVGQGGTHGYHRIFNKQAKAFTHTGVPETPNGTITFAEDQTEPILVNQETVYKDVYYYNVITDKYFNIFANGILTSCSLSNQYKIENMKYIGDKLIPDDEITRYFEEHKNLQLAQ